jgi:signal transduction histidine kinase/ligand-binding sensor domain-containing protein/CheY-like chemotaxis protein
MQQYSLEDGLAHPYVYAINQDSYGFLWIGTSEGLYRFDGFRFEYFTEQNGLGSNFITSIFRDSDGRMWFGHSDGSLSYRYGEEFIVLNDSADSPVSVMDFTEDNQGILWAALQNQDLLTIKKGEQIESVHFPYNNEPLSQLAFLVNNYLLIGTQDNIYLSRYARDEGSMEEAFLLESYQGSKVVEILKVSPERYIVISQDEGIYQLDFDTLSYDFTFSQIESNSDGKLDNLQGGIIDNRGRLWLNSMGGGLLIYNMGDDKGVELSEKINTLSGLVSDNIRSIFRDYEGNIWFGLYGDGILRYVENNILIYPHTNENLSINTYAVNGYEDGLIIAKDGALLRLSRSGDTILQTFPVRLISTDDRINTVFRDEDGNTWIGCERSGLKVRSATAETFRDFHISNDNLANSVNHITGMNGILWVGTKKGVCRIDNASGNRHWITTRDGLPHNNIRQLYIDSQERVFIATICSEIFYLTRKGSVITLENSRLTPFCQVVSIAEYPVGTLWIATRGNGVWKVSDEGNQNFTRTAGLLSDFCYSISITGEKMPIVGHRGGLSRIDPATNRIKIISHMSGIKGSADFYSNAVYADEPGYVWFGTSDGLVKYISEISDGGKMAPRLHISAVYIDGEKVDHSGGQIFLKAGQYELGIEYIGISFTNPEEVIYQTRLEGYNKDWSDYTSSRRVVYDRIGHGRYSMAIRAFNENDIGSEITSALEMVIRKPVYLTFWFYLVMTLIISFTVYLIIRWREKNLRDEQQRLLKNLDEKSREIIVKEEIIKERKKVEKVLIEAKEKAELSEKLKTSFLQNMSHEIRTPMNAIVGFTSLLKNKLGSDTKQLEYIKIIDTNAESLLNLIDDILDVSQLETNQLQIRHNPCKINALIMELNSKYEEILQVNNKTDIKLIPVLPGKDDLEFITDPGRLKQVLTKMLDNAVKFTEKGEISFGYECLNSEITFFVEDTGIGLSDEKAKVIFDLFRKIEDDKLKLYGGTGLGLTLARYLVHLLGGEIEVESEENVGSRFSFTLPLTSPSKGSKEIPQKDGSEDFAAKWRDKTVLIVEDTDSNFMLLEQILKPTGIVISRASNGETALQKYSEEGSYDIIIMDIKLPGMDGYEVTRKIREKDGDIPVISYTAYAMEDDREKSLEAGCNEYFAKPMDNIILLKTISGYLS